jgi:hypothetical protein
MTIGDMWQSGILRRPRPALVKYSVKASSIQALQRRRFSIL